MGSVNGWIIGVIVLGIGANYLVLTAWVIVLWDRGRYRGESRNLLDTAPQE
jgi:hypothetical protein